MNEADRCPTGGVWKDITPLLLRGPGARAGLAGWLAGFRKILLVTGRGFSGRGGAFADLAASISSAEIVHATLAGEPEDGWLDEVLVSARGRVEAVVSVGGGSALDAGKALAALLEEEGPAADFLEGVGTKTPSGRMLPWFAVPTTGGTGSEASTNAVIARKGVFKRSLRHPNYRAAGIILDGELAVGAPARVVAASGMDAFTQLLETYLSPALPPVLEPWIETGLAGAARWLPVCVRSSPAQPPEGMQALLEAACISGAALSRAGLGTVHGLAGTAGAVSSVPHGIFCARMIGPCLRESVEWLAAREERAALSRMARAARAAGFSGSGDLETARTLARGVLAWAAEFDLPPLRDFGVGPEEVERIVAAGADRNNPAKLGPQIWRELLSEAGAE